MTTSYEEAAYTEEQIQDALRTVGHRDFKNYVAEQFTAGLTLTEIAEKLDLNPQRFWAFYQVWCREHAEPLRLSPEEGDEDE